MTSTPMRAVVVTTNGGTEVLQLQERPLPEPGPTQLLVEVAAAGVNFIDIYRREGRYPTQPPFVQGSEFAGTVVAVGAEVREFAVGDRVATTDAVGGAQATHALVDEANAIPVPAEVPLDLAAAVLLQGMTAHYLVKSTFAVTPEHEVLVHAAAGGAGGLVVQLARAAGAHVIGTVGSEAKAEAARSHGADAVIRYDEIGTGDALVDAVREASAGGVHVVYDGVGASTFEASLASLRTRGMLVLFGASSGAVPPFDLQRLNAAGSLYVTRPSLGHYTADRAELLWRASEVLAAVGDATLRVTIGGRYSLDDAAQAYEDLAGRKTTGKLLIVP